MQSQPVQTMLVSRLGWPSLRTDVNADVEPWMQPHVAAVNEALRHGVFRTNVSYWAEYERIANEAVQRILWPRQDPAHVLPPLAARLEALRKRQ